jgi:predicted nuclease of predicted toxin-antitoxin system
MRFLLDMNLPPAVAEWLRSEGHDAIHVLDAKYGDLPDREIDRGLTPARRRSSGAGALPDRYRETEP